MLKADDPTKEAGAGTAGWVDKRDYEVKCLPMESSDIVYNEVSSSGIGKVIYSPGHFLSTLLKC